jgi:hypothetical protein
MNSVMLPSEGTNSLPASASISSHTFLSYIMGARQRKRIYHPVSLLVNMKHTHNSKSSKSQAADSRVDLHLPRLPT